MREKKGLSFPAEYMGWLILGIVLLIAILVSVFVLKEKFSGWADLFNSIRRYGQG